MPYADLKSCEVDDRRIVVHGEFVSVRDKCFVCNDGELVEDYDHIYGGMAGGGTSEVPDGK